MPVTNYSNFRKHLKTYIDDCVAKNNTIIINRKENGSVVLIPLEKYKDLDETDFLKTQKKYAAQLLKTFNLMKAKTTEMLTPETYAAQYGK